MQEDYYFIINLVYLFSFLSIVFISIIIFLIIVQQKKQLLKQIEFQDIKSAYQNEMLDATILIQEEEKNKISEFLHDHTSAELVVFKMQIFNLIKNVKNDKSIKNDISLLQEMINSISNVHYEIRNLSHGLSSGILLKFGLFEVVKDYCFKYADSLNINLKFYFNCQEPEFNKNKKVAIYRILCELFNNALKHANASLIIIDCKIIHSELRFRVFDNGMGMFYSKSLKKRQSFDRHLGLLNIDNRIRYIKGKIEYKSGKAGKTIVNISIPL